MEEERFEKPIDPIKVNALNPNLKKVIENTKHFAKEANIICETVEPFLPAELRVGCVATEFILQAVEDVSTKILENEDKF